MICIGVVSVLYLMSKIIPGKSYLNYQHIMGSLGNLIYGKIMFLEIFFSISSFIMNRRSPTTFELFQFEYFQNSR